MHPFLHAQASPNKPAYIMAGSGEIVTYAMLDRASNQGAHLFRSLGLQVGDVIALCMENNARYLEIAWAAQRAGLYWTCVSSKLTAGEVDYIVRDCGAKAFITSKGLGALIDDLAPYLYGITAYCVGGDHPYYQSYERATLAMPATPIADQTSGLDMLYSSGTTGRPKGIKSALTGEPVEAPTTLSQLMPALFQVKSDSIYLSPAPLYHAAPLRWCMGVQRLGGTIVIMEKFDAEWALALIEKHQVTVSQWVPTHFVRMLRLPETTRRKYDLSSLKIAAHAAAPCPIAIKEQMIDWWGPVLHEYYAGTEGNGMTFIPAADWLRKKGSVGKAVYGQLKICDDDGLEVPAKTEGAVYFAGTKEFAYHNAPDKTAQSRNALGWSTLGDIGYVDEDGYLFLTDRKAFMIISGGVNIYPQEIENVLTTHPKVMDVAVIGAPDDEMGEQVVAIVQPVNIDDAGDALAAELMHFAGMHLSQVKLPRRIDFSAELPRHANGKLYKRLLRDAYWGKHTGKIV
ncbi:MAG TPA: acyl-CoA synthetase [Steroidobacteraceae bacterium]|nr:acyl-CoA synthetase [Steroidobacteraceae bacterium]